MTNPNNAIGTNGAFGGRTSVNAFNDGVASYSKGILSGWACEPSSGLTVILGGDGNTRDVAIAEDNAGNKTTINNISGSPVSVTIGSAPNNNSRIDSIVAYVNNPPTGTSTATDNYGACGLIVVAGTVSSTPSAPSESAIRAAITADGASGTTAYYVVLANITISSGTTDLTSDNIVQDSKAQIGANNIDFTTLSLVPGELIQDYGNKTNGQTFVAPNQACIFTAECVVTATQGGCRIYRVRDGGNILCAGIPFTNGTGNDQVVANFMALPNEEFLVSISKSGLVQSLKAYTIADSL